MLSAGLLTTAARACWRQLHATEAPFQLLDVVLPSRAPASYAPPNALWPTRRLSGSRRAEPQRPRRRSPAEEMPSRETWFCLYQPVRGQTAYLYEADEPITAETYVSKVGPELRRAFGRPAKDCFIATIGGESFAAADVATHPWYCYRLLLRGRRLGRRLGPYGADDVVSPNCVALPLQQRWRNNVRDVRDILLLLADPTHDRLQAATTALVAAAHEDRWAGGAALVHELLLRRWGGAALRRHGLTPAAVAAAYRLHGERLRQLELQMEGEGEGAAAAVEAGAGEAVAEARAGAPVGDGAGRARAAAGAEVGAGAAGGQQQAAAGSRGREAAVEEEEEAGAACGGPDVGDGRDARAGEPSGAGGRAVGRAALLAGGGQRGEPG